MNSISRNLSDTIKDRLLDLEDEEASPQKKRLLNTIKVPKDLLMISERLPKPQYHLQSERASSKMSKQMKRNNSVPEEMDKLPEIQMRKKESKAIEERLKVK